MDIHEAETAVKVIQRQNEFGEQVCQQLQDARAIIDRQAAEIKRLREALEKIRTLLFRLQWADIGTGEAIEEITNIVKETDHE